MQGDAYAPAIWGRPHDQETYGCEEDDADHPVCARDAEIDHGDEEEQWNPVADDREGPGIAGIALEDQAADRAALEMVRPSIEERAASTVWTPFAPASRERSADSRSSGHRRKPLLRWHAGRAARPRGGARAYLVEPAAAPFTVTVTSDVAMSAPSSANARSM